MSQMIGVQFQQKPILMSAPPSLRPFLGQAIPLYSVMIPNRIFVGGLSDETSTIDLRDSFSPFGTVMFTKIIFDNEGCNKGYGFVTFQTDAEAKNCMGQCVVIHNRRVNIAQAFKKKLAQRVGGSFFISTQREVGPPAVLPIQHYASANYAPIGAPGWVQASAAPPVQFQPIYQYFNAVPTEWTQDLNQELNCAQTHIEAPNCTSAFNQEWDVQVSNSRDTAWEFDVSYSPHDRLT